MRRCVLFQHGVGVGELSADDRPGFVVEGDPDDVEQVGCFLDACPVRQRLQLCRDERSRLGNLDRVLACGAPTDGTDMQ